MENRLFTEIVFAAPAVMLAEAFSLHAPQRCYMYRFEYSGSILGAAHAVELPLLFGTHQRHIALRYFSGARSGQIETAKRISSQMMDAFSTFMRIDDAPIAVGKLSWPPYRRVAERENSPARSVFVFDRTCKVVEGSHEGVAMPELTSMVQRSRRPFGVCVSTRDVTTLPDARL